MGRGVEKPAFGGVCLLGLLLGGFSSPCICSFFLPLSPSNTEYEVGGLVDARRGHMGVARLVFVAAAAVVATETPGGASCDENYQKTVCPTVCTSTLAEQCAAGV